MTDAADTLTRAYHLVDAAFGMSHDPLRAVNYEATPISGSKTWREPQGADHTARSLWRDASQHLTTLHRHLATACAVIAEWIIVRHQNFPARPEEGYGSASAMGHAILTARYTVRTLDRLDLDEWDIDLKPVDEEAKAALRALQTLVPTSAQPTYCRRCGEVSGYRQQQPAKWCTACACEHSACTRVREKGRRYCTKDRKAHEAHGSCENCSEATRSALHKAVMDHVERQSA